METSVRNIQEISAWSPQGSITADKIQLYNFHNYNFDESTDSIVSYRLFKYIQLDGMEQTVEVKQVLNEGSVSLPASLVATWGASDEPIFDYVIQQLGLVKIN